MKFHRSTSLLLVGVCYWPIVQVINFSFIKERNRVPFVAMASFLWTIFLAYMKQLDAQALQNQQLGLPAVTPPNIFDQLWSNILQQQK